MVYYAPCSSIYPSQSSFFYLLRKTHLLSFNLISPSLLLSYLFSYSHISALIYILSYIFSHFLSFHTFIFKSRSQHTNAPLKTHSNTPKSMHFIPTENTHKTTPNIPPKSSLTPNKRHWYGRRSKRNLSRPH
jgi:hypothetical protein